MLDRETKAWSFLGPGLIRDALHSSNAEDNGLTREALANLFAEVWFERMPLDFRASSQELKPADVTNLQRIAEGVTEVADRRSAFVAAFLEATDESAVGPV